MYILPHIYLFSTTFIPCYNNVEENSNQQSLSRKKERCSPMGNHKFRFSDMLPNTWFYKLRDMSKTKKPKTSASKKKNPYSSYSTTLPKPQFSQPRSSFYYAAKSIKVSETYFLDPPRKSSTKITNRKTIYKPSPKHNIPSSVSSTKDNFLELDFFKSPSSEFDSDCSDASQSFNQVPSCPNSCICQLISSANDIIIDINGNGHTKQFKNIGAGYDTISELELPPIHTKKMAIHRRAVGYNASRVTDHLKVKVFEPKTFDGTRSTNKLENFLLDMEQYFDVACVQEKEKVTTASMYLSGDAKLWWRTCMTNVKKADEPKIDTWEHMKKKLKDRFLPKTRVLGTSASRKYVNFSPSSGIKLRTNSTKIASKNSNGRDYKSVSLKKRLEPQKERCTTGSFAIVKTSIDPEKDFRESMMEMVVENNIKASKDLENLLACYLSLNSDEYHDLIIKAFQQIWFNLPEPHL